MQLKRLVIESFLLLLYFEFLMRFRTFETLHKCVRQRSADQRTTTDVSSEDLCRSMNLACVFYFKRVLCLQRSAATTLLLRRYGWKAEMLTGVQILPLEAHSWVEIEGTVVNDAPYMPEIYQVLERC
jgi:Transglutaminase-like superfamily